MTGGFGGGFFVPSPWRRNGNTVQLRRSGLVAQSVLQTAASIGYNTQFNRTGALAAGEFMVGFSCTPGGNAGDNINSFVTALWAQAPVGPAAKEVIFVEGNQAGASFWNEVILANDNDIVIRNVKETVGAPGDILLEVSAAAGTIGNVRLSTNDGTTELTRARADTNGFAVVRALACEFDVSTTLAADAAPLNPANLTHATRVYVDNSTGANLNIRGVAGGRAGRRLVIYNASDIAAETLTLTNEDAGSGNAADRLHLPSAASVVMPAASSIELEWDENISRWRPVSLGSPNVTDISLTDNLANAFLIHEGAANEYLTIDTTNAQEQITFGERTATAASLARMAFHIDPADANALLVRDNSRTWLVIDSNSGFIQISGSGSTQDIRLGSASGSGVSVLSVIPDNVASAWVIEDPANTNYFSMSSVNGSENIELGNTITDPTIRTLSMFSIDDAMRLNATLSPTALAAAGTTNNYAPSGLVNTNVLRLTVTPVGGHTITGIVPPTDTNIALLILNISAGTTETITLTHDDAGSTAANRFLLPGNVSLLLPSNSGIWIWYDSSTNRWRTGGGPA